MGDKFHYEFTGGIESDLRQSTTAYSGTSTIADLESFALQTAGVSQRNRGFASASLSYQLVNDQQLTSSLSMRTQPFTGQGTTTLMVGYRLSF